MRTSPTNAQLMRMPKHDLVHRITVVEGTVDRLVLEAKEQESAKKELIDTMNERHRIQSINYDKLSYELREARSTRDVYWALLRKLVGR